ncbi:MAG: alpha/beta hydrolase, partial [Pseudonocardiaceae bacterium]
FTPWVGRGCLHDSMTSSSSQPITGTAAGVPFTALPPPEDRAHAPLVVIWHLLDPPCTDSAMAAALPMAAFPAWRLYLGLPMTGRRLPAGGSEEMMRLGLADPVLNLFGPILSQAADEAPAAVAAVRSQLCVSDGPIGVAGGSLGGGVAMEVIAAGALPVSVAALVNPFVRMPSAVAAIERVFDVHYGWTDASRAVAGRFDFLRRSAEIATAEPALLLVSGADDHPEFRADAEALDCELASRYRDRSRVRLHREPGMPHHLAEPPGVEPAPQTVHAAAVDAAFTSWFTEHLTRPAH